MCRIALACSLEDYIQQIGRAGRDGQPSFCHLLLDDGHFLLLRSLAHSDGVDASQIFGLLRDVFDPAIRAGAPVLASPVTGVLHSGLAVGQSPSDADLPSPRPNALADGRGHSDGHGPVSAAAVATGSLIPTAVPARGAGAASQRCADPDGFDDDDIEDQDPGFDLDDVYADADAAVADSQHARQGGVSGVSASGIAYGCSGGAGLPAATVDGDGLQTVGVEVGGVPTANATTAATTAAASSHANNVVSTAAAPPVHTLHAPVPPSGVYDCGGKGPVVVSVDTWTMGNRHNLRPTVAETLLHYLQSLGFARVSELRDERDGGNWKKRSPNAKRTFVCDVKAVPVDVAALAAQLEAQTRVLEDRAVDKLDCGTRQSTAAMWFSTVAIVRVVVGRQSFPGVRADCWCV